MDSRENPEWLIDGIPLKPLSLLDEDPSQQDEENERKQLLALEKEILALCNMSQSIAELVNHQQVAIDQAEEKTIKTKEVINESHALIQKTDALNKPYHQLSLFATLGGITLVAAKFCPPVALVTVGITSGYFLWKQVKPSVPENIEKKPYSNSVKKDR